MSELLSDDSSDELPESPEEASSAAPAFEAEPPLFTDSVIVKLAGIKVIS